MINLELLNAATPQQLQRKIADSIIAIRKRRKISQKELARQSGVSYGSIRRFETEGEISLASLARLAIALDLSQELAEVFAQVPYRSIEEVINEQD